jgi:iron complex outermembrane receptor protein
VLPPTLTISGAFPTFKYKQVQATYTSLNFSLSVDVTRGLCLFTRNTMLWAYNLSAKQFLLTAPPHRFQLGARYEFNDKKWFEHPYIEVLGSHTTRQYLVDPALDYSPPPAAYTLLNVEAGFTAHIRNTHFTVSVAAANLLNTSYRDYLDRFRYFTDAMGRNFSIKLHIPFGSSDY